MYLSLANIGILENILNRWHTLSEEVNAKLLELCAGNGGAEVLALKESFAFNFSLMGR